MCIYVVKKKSFNFCNTVHLIGTQIDLLGRIFLTLFFTMLLILNIFVKKKK